MPMKPRSFGILLMVALALAAVFAAYLRPEMAVMAANWISSCF